MLLKLQHCSQLEQGNQRLKVVMSFRKHFQRWDSNLPRTQEKSSSESRWVCRVNDAWRADEMSTSSDSHKGSGSGTKPVTTTTGASLGIEMLRDEHRCDRCDWCHRSFFRYHIPSTDGKYVHRDTCNPIQPHSKFTSGFGVLFSI